MFKKNKYLFTILCGILCGIFLCIAVFSMFSYYGYKLLTAERKPREISTEELTYNLFGKHFYLGNIISSYNSERAFNGDGYSIYVFEMSEELSTYITDNFLTIKDIYPDKPYFRVEWTTDWIIEKWRDTPFNEEEKWLYNFAIDAEYQYENDLTDKSNATKSISYFKKLMNEEGSFYSYNYYSMGMNIDFFVFNIEDNILVFINHDT